MKKTQITTALLLLLGLGSCVSAESDNGKDHRWGAEVFHRETEIDEVEINDVGFVQSDKEDVKRSRTGVRATFGYEYARAYVETFGEDFLADEYAWGIGGGITGEPVLHRFNDELSLILSYRAGLAAVAADDAIFAGEEGDYTYTEVSLEAGIGLDYRGFRPSVGITTSRLEGHIDFDDEENDETDDKDIEADFAAGYVELAYRPRKAPLQISVRGLAGEEQGVYARLSWTF
jgi:hypothetical protein